METKSRILIVDDNKELCDSLKDFFEDDEFIVETVNNGKDAIDLLQNNRYDIALVDFKLPDISGTELINNLVSVSPSIEFILITAHATLDSAIDAVKQEHVISYELKPLDMNHLLSVLNQVTKRRKAEEKTKKLIQQLQDALAKVKLLSGLIPICSSCKKIRNDKGFWEQVESYICAHSEADFTHSVCPDCAKRLYPDIYELYPDIYED